MATVVQLNGRVGSIVPVDILWTKESGPSTAVFADATDPDTTVTLGAADGTYVLKLTATTEDNLTSSDTMEIYTAANVAPVADAGADFTTFPNTSFLLQGSATDDEWPVPHSLTYTWSKVSGTGTVTFSPTTDGGVTSNVANPTCTISAAGAFVLRLTVSDSLLQDTDDVAVTVSAAPGTMYAEATPDNTPGGVALTEVEYMVDLSALDATWWTNMISATGDDIRVATAAGVLLPFDKMSVDKVAKTGFLIYKRNVSAGGAGVIVRIYNGLSIAALPDSDPNGRYAAYNANSLGFWPGGGGTSTDRTINGNDLTVVGSPVVTFPGGPVGNAYTTFGTGKYSYRFLGAGITSGSFTYCSAFSTNLSGSQVAELGGVVRTQAASSNNANNNAYVQGIFNSTQKCRIGKNYGPGLFSDAEVTAGSATWRLYAGTFPVSTGTITAVTLSGTGTDSSGNMTGPLDMLIVGARPRLSPTDFSQAVSQTLTSLYAANMGTAWLTYRGQMLDQATFWTTWVTV